MSLPRLSAAVLATALALAAALPAGAGTVVEFYHRGLDHYFVTSLPSEVEALDSGRIAGWARTGLSFETFAAGDARLAGSVPVCRFLGNPARGLTSHFYSAFAEECATVKVRWPDEWRLETDELFRVHLVNPTTGQCPAGTKAVFRLWNRRADANHRYTTERSVFDAMVGRGYVPEGTGSPQLPVAFWAADVAPPPPPAGAPACTIASGAAVPVVGTPVTLTATCTNSPAAFAWSNCTPTGNTCVATATATGRVAYTLVASNAAGAGAQARIELDWQLPASAAPVCSIVASSATLPLGSALTLTANCSHAPSQFQWMGCSALLLEVCNVLSECPTTAGTCPADCGADEAAGPDDFELGIGNFLAYSIPLWQGSDYLTQLKEKWLPYYNEELRLHRLERVRWFCLNNLHHIPLYVERGLYFQSFDRLYNAYREFLQALFIARRTYPIAYNKCIHEQVVEILGLPELYEQLTHLFEIKRFESTEIADKAKEVEELLEKYAPAPEAA